MAASQRALPLLLTILGFSLAPGIARARTFVIPHVVETSLSTSNSYSYDTSLHFVYSPGLVDLQAAPGATAQVYLLDAAGTAVLSATNNPVCNPCVVNLNAGLRRAVLTFQSAFDAAGGMNGSVFTGLALVEVTGDENPVTVGAVTSHSRTSLAELYTVVESVVELPGGLSPTGRLMVFPMIVENSSNTVTDINAFDNFFYAVYGGGLPGSSVPAGTGASVALYLFEDDGTPLKSANASNVCLPCLANVSAGTPKASFSVHSLIAGAGGFASSVELGFALVVVTGTADAVAVQGFLSHSTINPEDLTIDELRYEELPYYPPPTAVNTPSLGTWLRAFPNPSRSSSRIEYTTGSAGLVRVEIVDVRGVVVARPFERHQDAGTHALDWDGRGDAGNTLPSGVYFARVLSPEGPRVVKLTLVR